MFTQAKAIGDMVCVALEVRLGGEIFGPVPLLLQRLVKAVGILHALDVHPGARVAIPVPRATDPVARLETHHLVIAQAVYGVHSGEAGADDDDISCFDVRVIH